MPQDKSNPPRELPVKQFDAQRYLTTWSNRELCLLCGSQVTPSIKGTSIYNFCLITYISELDSGPIDRGARTRADRHKRGRRRTQEGHTSGSRDTQEGHKRDTIGTQEGHKRESEPSNQHIQYQCVFENADV